MGRRPNDEKIEVVNIRMVKEPSIYSTEKIRTPDDVLRVIANELATYDREVFAVLNLKTNGQPINLNIWLLCAIGSSVFFVHMNKYYVLRHQNKSLSIWCRLVTI